MEEGRHAKSFDYKHPSGVFLGAWASNVDETMSEGNVEVDLSVAKPVLSADPLGPTSKGTNSEFQHSLSRERRHIE